MDKPPEDSLSSSTTRTSSTEAVSCCDPQRSAQVFVSDVEEGTFGAPQLPSQALDAFSSEEELGANFYVNYFQEAFVRMPIYFIQVDERFQGRLWELDEVFGPARLFRCPNVEGGHLPECKARWEEVEPLKLVSLQYVKGLGRMRTARH
jgi:hypothetical protein